MKKIFASQKSKKRTSSI